MKNHTSFVAYYREKIQKLAVGSLIYFDFQNAIHLKYNLLERKKISAIISHVSFCSKVYMHEKYEKSQGVHQFSTLVTLL